MNKPVDPLPVPPAVPSPNPGQPADKGTND